jgi:hypothetical protein
MKKPAGRYRPTGFLAENLAGFASRHRNRDQPFAAAALQAGLSFE